MTNYRIYKNMSNRYVINSLNKRLTRGKSNKLRGRAVCAETRPHGSRTGEKMKHTCVLESYLLSSEEKAPAAVKTGDVAGMLVIIFALAAFGVFFRFRKIRAK